MARYNVYDIEGGVTDYEVFEKYWKVGSEMTTEENEQLFLFGYVIAKEFDRETIL